MRAMRAERFTGYQDLKLVEIAKPAVSDGRVLVRLTAAGVTPLDHTILSGGHLYPLAEAGEALRHLTEDRLFGKVVLAG